MTRDPRPPLDQAPPIGAHTADVVTRLAALAQGQPLPAFEVPPNTPLTDLAAIFSLEPTSLQLLATVLACETEASAGQRLAELGAVGGLTVAMAERIVGPLVGAALAASAPLRRWRMVELAGHGPLCERVIRMDERILDYLLERPGLDARLEGLVQASRSTDTAVKADDKHLERLVGALTAKGPPPVLVIEGGFAEQRRTLVQQAAAQAGARVLRLDAADLPSTWTERFATALYLDRELALSRAILMIEADADAATGRDVSALVEQLLSPVAILAPEVALPEREPVLRLRLPQPTRNERRIQWQAALASAAPSACVDHLATQFALSPRAIRSVAAEIAGHDACVEDADLWHAARRRSRGPLDGLAQRITARVRWDDLVVPADTKAALKDLAAHQGNAWRVLSDWGWTQKGDRGLGTAVLFSGASGTGKTLAAEVIANELSLDLYQIDLSRVISKYIGETEKNLSRIFEAAEAGGAILLFDEADALFGKRSEVKDSHDRYANVEVSYLLQRMEAYRGLAILTTNQRNAVDRAFLRRLRQVVVFPFPDMATRAEIWAHVFPADTPLEGIDPGRLARLSLAGGGIRSIALNASFLAAAENAPVRPDHLRRAARREYAKLEKPFTATEAEVFS